MPSGSADIAALHEITLPITFRDAAYTCVSGMCSGGTNWARTQYLSTGSTNSSVMVTSYCHYVSYGTYSINIVCIGV